MQYTFCKANSKLERMDMERGAETPEGLTFYTSVFFYSRMQIFKNMVFFKSAKASHFYFHEKKKKTW